MIWFTWFCCKAVARYSAPWSPIWLPAEIKCSQCLWKMSEWMVRWKVKWCDLIYLILVQSIRQIFCSLITDLIEIEMKCSQCLCKNNEWMVRWKLKWCDLIYLILVQYSAVARYSAWLDHQSICQIFAPSPIWVREIKCSQCLWRVLGDKLWKLLRGSC